MEVTARVLLNRGDIMVTSMVKPMGDGARIVVECRLKGETKEVLSCEGVTADKKAYKLANTLDTINVLEAQAKNVMWVGTKTRRVIINFDTPVQMGTAKPVMIERIELLFGSDFAANSRAPLAPAPKVAPSLRVAPPSLDSQITVDDRSQVSMAFDTYGSVMGGRAAFSQSLAFDQSYHGVQVAAGKRKADPFTVGPFQSERRSRVADSHGEAFGASSVAEAVLTGPDMVPAYAVKPVHGEFFNFCGNSDIVTTNDSEGYARIVALVLKDLGPIYNVNKDPISLTMSHPVDPRNALTIKFDPASVTQKNHIVISVTKTCPGFTLGSITTNMMQDPVIDINMDKFDLRFLIFEKTFECRWRLEYFTANQVDPIQSIIPFIRTMLDPKPAPQADSEGVDDSQASKYSC